MRINRLKGKEVETLKAPGLYPDGNNLWLQVRASRSETGGSVSRSWIFRYRYDGKVRSMGLGSLNYVSLTEARARARELLQTLKVGKFNAGVDPIEARRAVVAERQRETARLVTFEEAAERFLAEKRRRGVWSSDKHGAQWPASLGSYVYPVFGKLSVADIDKALVLKAIEPLWGSKTETATRVRGRIEAILDYAAAHGFRSGENPARWKGGLDKVLEDPSRLHRVKHHAALPYDQIAAFMADLENCEGLGALALRFTIFTAARTREVIGARWSEFDLSANIWTVPAARMKARSEHRVPLSDPAVDLIRGLHAVRLSDDAFVFGLRGRAVSNMTMASVLKRMDRADITVHGFRSTFRDWASEQTNFSREVCEAALAHKIESKVERAYRRGDLFAKRAQLMAAWARHCLTPASEQSAAIINLHSAQG